MGQARDALRGKPPILPDAQAGQTRGPLVERSSTPSEPSGKQYSRSETRRVTGFENNRWVSLPGGSDFLIPKFRSHSPAGRSSGSLVGMSKAPLLSQEDLPCYAPAPSEGLSRSSSSSCAGLRSAKIDGDDLSVTHTPPRSLRQVRRLSAPYLMTWPWQRSQTLLARFPKVKTCVNLSNQTNLTPYPPLIPEIN